MGRHRGMRWFRNFALVLAIAVVASLVVVLVMDPTLSGVDGILSADGPPCVNVTAPLTCPPDGSPAPPLCRTCGAGIPKIEYNQGSACSSKFNVSGLAYSAQQSWSITNQRTAPLNMPTTALAHDACIMDSQTTQGITYDVFTTTSGLVYTLSGGSARLEISNAGDCSAQLVSILVYLEQVTPVTKVWAVSGVEFADLMINCPAGQGAASPAYICREYCGIAVAYDSGLLSISNVTNVEQGGSWKSVPKGGSCENRGTLGFNVAYGFKLPGATLLEPVGSLYRARIQVTLDACCANGDACGIDYNCDGIAESVRTIEITTPNFTLVPNSNNPNGTPCTSAVVRDAVTFYAKETSEAFPSVLPEVLPVALLAAPGHAVFRVDDPTLVCCDAIRSSILEDSNRTTTFNPKAALNVRLISEACLSPLDDNTCNIDGCQTVVSKFNCAAIVDCQTSQPTTTVVTNCSAGTATITLNSSIVVPPSNGGASCPPLSNYTTVDLVYSQWSAWSACDNYAQPPARNRTRSSTNYGSCHQVEYLNSTVGEWGAWSPCDGLVSVRTRQTNIGCDDAIVQTESVDCAPVDCEVSSWSEWIVSVPCATDTDPVCTSSRMRMRQVVVPASNGGLPCGPLVELDNGPCTSLCEYSETPFLCDVGSCDPGICYVNSTCSYAAVSPSRCSDGTTESCPVSHVTTQQSCGTCAYSTWSSWTAYTECSHTGEGCTTERNRTRTLITACGSTNASTCVETLDQQILPCACSSGCITNADCNVNNQCETYQCGGDGKCYLTEIKLCFLGLSPCQTSRCDPDSGQCTAPVPKNCDDNNLCTDDTCNPTNGACIHTYRTPAYSDPCSTPTCIPSVGIPFYVPNVCPDGTECDPRDPTGTCRPPCTTSADCAYADTDTNNCTFPVCSNGNCLVQGTFCGLSQECNPQTGVCEAYGCPIFTCPSGQRPNLTDCTCTCDATSCPSTNCTIGTCHPTTKQCSFSPKSCSDGNACTIDGVCDESIPGGCPTPTPQNCSTLLYLAAEHPCLVPYCDPTYGCQYGQPPPSTCDDGNPCTNDKCTQSGCVNSPKCQGPDLCVPSRCALNGTCLPSSRDLDCCFSNADCTQSWHTGTCVFLGSSVGKCQIKLDFNPCSNQNGTGTVIGVNGTMYPVCSDGNQCTAGDYCTSNGACQGTPCGWNLNLPAYSCAYPRCTAYGCDYTANDGVCDDGIIYTRDSCNPLQCPDSPTNCYHEALAGTIIELFEECT